MYVSVTLLICIYFLLPLDGQSADSEGPQGLGTEFGGTPWLPDQAFDIDCLWLGVHDPWLLKLIFTTSRLLQTHQWSSWQKLSEAQQIPELSSCAMEHASTLVQKGRWCLARRTWRRAHVAIPNQPDHSRKTSGEWEWMEKYPANHATSCQNCLHPSWKTAYP